jgi:hypothetical protein
MSDEQSNFKVTDRRLFNPDGSPRELSADEKAEQSPVILPETPAVGEAAPLSTKEEAMSSGVAGQSERAEAEDEEIDLPDADNPSSFVNFIMSIASNAASALGMIEHPVTNKREVDLQLGKHWIDVLGMLEQKTRGNLVSQEEQILEGLLADLRMQFVSLANSPSTKASRSYSGHDITGGR